MENLFAFTPMTPYFAVIFTSIKATNTEEYDATATRMLNLAKIQDGFLGVESARNTIGITVSYWDSLEAIKIWKNQLEHLAVQKKGKAEWYKAYKVRIAKVVRDYEFSTIA